jgi:hypothetical protein
VIEQHHVGTARANDTEKFFQLTSAHKQARIRFTAEPTQLPHTAGPCGQGKFSEFSQGFLGPLPGELKADEHRPLTAVRPFKQAALETRREASAIQS